MDAESRTLQRDEEILPLPPRAFDTLKFLVLNAGRIVSKEELLDAVWGDTAVLESNLASQIMALRQRLGTDADGQPFIRTAARQGYYLVLQVTKGLAEQEPVPLDLARAQEPQQLDPDDPTRKQIECSAPGELQVDEWRVTKGPVEQEPVPLDLARAQEPQEPDPDYQRRKELEFSAPGDPFVAEQATPIRKLGPFPRWVTLALVASVAAVLLAIKLWPGGILGPGIPPFPRFGRLLTRSTSEGWRPEQISLSHRPSYLAISPRGDKVFAADEHGRTLSIISTTNNSVITLALPQDAGPLAVSRSGKLYIGSSVEGIMVVDVEPGRLRPGLIATGGSVLGMAITPEGDKLYLAMSNQGLKRLSIGSGELTQVSDRICPEYLEMDRQGKRLYVAYQCSGPTGWPGHDSVGIFDVEREISLGFVSGPPMVGGQPSVSPDGKLVLLDGWDACSAPQYDHQGCKSVPSHVFHLLDPSGRQILHTFEFPIASSPARFLDNSRFLLLGREVSVVDAARYSILERWNNAADCDATDIVFTPDGRRAYLGCGRNNSSIFALQPESAECSPPQQGLAMYYAADGTTADSAGASELTSHGKPRFAPGRVGQAFFLDGGSYLSTSSTGHYQFGHRESTLAIYVKFAGIQGEMALADWTDENSRPGIRLLKSAGNHFVFQSWPDGSPLESKTLARPDIWYHLVVTRAGHDLTLYVNGKPESHGTPPPPFKELWHPPLFLGAQSGIPSFHGWLDEIAFYNRALTAEEVEDLYQLRESGPCKL
jgi:DNA-binding winged helix-turn-helix (wHTH) protein/DNA-binding beta-propeller fold protein YncE